MALSRRQILLLLETGELTITPYSSSMLEKNHYILSNDGTIRYYENDFSFNTTIDTANPPGLINDTITKYGFTLEPNKLYYMRAKETIISENYSGQVAPSRTLTQYGLLVNCDSNIDFSCGGDIEFTLSSVLPITIYPDKPIGEFYLTEADSGGAQVPIGGIIAWHGGTVPYGYEICDGHDGTPNLVGRFIYGGNSTGSTGGHKAVTIKEENLPRHSHTVTSVSQGIDTVIIPEEGTPKIIAGGMSSSESTTGFVGNGVPMEIIPEYYTLIFIIRVR